MTQEMGEGAVRRRRPTTGRGGVLRGAGVEGSLTTRGDVSNFTTTRRARGQMVQEAGA